MATVLKLLNILVELWDAYQKHKLKQQILKEINSERVLSFEQIKKDTEHLTRDELVARLRSLRK